MALQVVTLFGEAFTPLAALAAPVLWMLSPAFRTRTRDRWERLGRRARIADVMGWTLAWVCTGIVVGVILIIGNR